MPAVWSVHFRKNLCWKMFALRELCTFGGPKFRMVQSFIFRSKVIFANFDQQFFAPQMFGFPLNSSICELLHLQKVQKFGKRTFDQSFIFAQKLYLQTLANTFLLAPLFRGT